MKKFIIVIGLVLLAIGLAYTARNMYSDIPETATNTILGTTTSATLNTNIPATTTETKTNTTNTNNKKHMNHVLLHTNKGTIELELSGDKPNTTANFAKLVESGFYNGVRFHRVIAGFMIQAGDPQSKDASLKSVWGTGGPGYKFADELTGKESYTQGTLAMANAGPNTNGSQFFIVTAKDAQLPPAYTVFGKVVSGMDVALEIEKVKRDSSDKPLEDVIITSAELK